jgi:hypothetical protein
MCDVLWIPKAVGPICYQSLSIRGFQKGQGKTLPSQRRWWSKKCKDTHDQWVVLHFPGINQFGGQKLTTNRQKNLTNQNRTSAVQGKVLNRPQTHPRITQKLKRPENFACLTTTCPYPYKKGAYATNQTKYESPSMRMCTWTHMRPKKLFIMSRIKFWWSPKTLKPLIKNPKLVSQICLQSLGFRNHIMQIVNEA